MMRLLSGSIIGLMISLFGSLLITLTMRFWGMMGSDLSQWLFFVSGPYFVSGYGLLCFFFYKKTLSPSHYWKVLYLYPTIILLVSCCFGTTIYEATLRDFDSINASGYLVSGMMYGLGLSPVLLAMNYVLYKKIFKIRLQVGSY